MHHPTRASTLYGFRILQLAVAIPFLVLICWCGVHRAWWNNINGTLGIGVIAVILTLIYSITGIVHHHRSNSTFLSGSTIKTLIRVGIEIILLLVYIATAGLMIRPRTGCITLANPDPGDSDLCFPPAAEGQIVESNGRYSDQPLTEWNVAIALSLLEVLSYLITVVLVAIQDRSGKVGGGSYA